MRRFLPPGVAGRLALLCLRISRHWLDRGSHRSAVRFARWATTAVDSSEFPLDLRLDTLDQLATTEQAMGDHSSAQLTRERAVEVAEGTGPAEPRLVAALIGRGEIYRFLGDLGKAEDDLSTAARLADALPTCPARASAHLALGRLHKDLGRHTEAAQCYRSAEKHLATTEADHDRLAAELYRGLAELAHARGDYAQAVTDARRALEIRARIGHLDHPDLARDLVVLAVALAEEGESEEAEALLNRAMEIFQRRLGPGHYEIATVLTSLSALKQAANDPAGAERLRLRALEIKEAVLGERHSEVGCLLNNIAVSLSHQGRDVEARRAYERALAILDTTLGRSHPHTVACRANHLRLVTPPSEG